MPEVRNYFFREAVQLDFLLPSCTKQSHKKACDINAIITRWKQTGQLEQNLSGRDPQYGDFTNVADYLGSLTKVTEAKDDFERLPADLRDRCDNDPAKFLAFVYDPANAEELRGLGLEKLVDRMHGLRTEEPVEPSPEPPKQDPPKVDPPP